MPTFPVVPVTFNVPLTTAVASGAIVPIPTFPLSITVNTVVIAELRMLTAMLALVVPTPTTFKRADGVAEPMPMFPDTIKLAATDPVPILTFDVDARTSCLLDARPLYWLFVALSPVFEPDIVGLLAIELPPLAEFQSIYCAVRPAAVPVVD
jgi:hypothetical protein